MAAAFGVLCYHRIVDDVIDGTASQDAWPYLERGTAIRLSTFIAQLADLLDFADLVPEPIALEILAGRRCLSRPAIWLTFDDSYRDALLVALHLEAATVFHTTHAADKTLPADAWYEALLDATRLRGTLDLGFGPFDYDLAHRQGRARLVNGPERRKYLRDPESARATTLATLTEQLKARGTARQHYLSRNDLHTLVSAGWSVGSHGVTHTPFDACEPEQMAFEARESLVELSVFGKVSSIALPDGAVPSAPETLLALGYACVLGLGNAPADPGAVIRSRFIVPDDPTWVRTALLPRLS